VSAGTRWLVTGARGQLGTQLCRLLAGDSAGSAGGDDLTGVGRAELDLGGDPAALGARIDEWAAGSAGRRLVVLNAAAWTDVDGAESDPAGAAAVNNHGAARLAQACARVGAALVHVSTDYVFDGDGDRPYEVDDVTEPRTEYGRGKLAGERAVRAAHGRHYIVRTGWLYGGSGRNFVKTIAAARHRRETLDVVDDQLGGPTWAAELAAGLVGLARSGAGYGTYHCAGAGRASWYELARAVFQEVGADPDRVRPCSTEQFPRPAPRPAYSVLSARSWTSAGLPAMSHWRDALRSAFLADRAALDPS
jgi:dTDP-4-dehydrorhamnose reductase